MNEDEAARRLAAGRLAAGLLGNAVESLKREHAWLVGHEGDIDGDLGRQRVFLRRLEEWRSARRYLVGEPCPGMHAGCRAIGTEPEIVRHALRDWLHLPFNAVLVRAALAARTGKT